MRTVTNLTALIGSDPNYKAPAKRQEIPQQVAKFVDRLFTRLKAIFPAWKTAFTSDEEYAEAKKVWVQALFNHGITSFEKFKTGLKQAEKFDSPFFPSVGQFISWCNENPYSDLGLPSPEELLDVYRQFRNAVCEPECYPWQSAVLYHLVLQLQRAIYASNLDEVKTLAKAKTLIAEMAKYLQTGGTVAEPKAAKLTAKSGRTLSTDERLQQISKIKAMMKCGGHEQSNENKNRNIRR